MGKLTSDVFNESCCDGGVCDVSGQSAQPCGCDPGIKYVSPSCPKRGIHSAAMESLKVWEQSYEQTYSRPGTGVEEDMKVKEWESFIASKSKMPIDKGPYSFVGLAGEVGEVMEWYKKTQLRNTSSDLTEQDLLEELGDVLHYVTRLSQAYGWTLKDVMKANKTKLDKRYGRNG